MVIGCPPGYEPKDDALEWARARAQATGGSCTVTHDPVEAARGADALYTDVWASMGQESETEARKQVFRPYQVNAALFAQAKPDAAFLHCLPAHRGEEVTDEAIDSPRSAVFQEAENRLHAQKAILHELMKNRRRGQSMRPLLGSWIWRQSVGAGGGGRQLAHPSRREGHHRRAASSTRAAPQRRSSSSTARAIAWW